jgi:predicted kinase
MNPTLLIIRGAPGSGKSTLAKKIIEDAEAKGKPIPLHFEADMWFEVNGGFDRSKLKDAHAWCQNITFDALEAGHSVIVSNTFTRLWEMDKYLLFAQENEIPVRVLVCTGQWQNIHGCPDQTVEFMRERFEEHPLDEVQICEDVWVTKCSDD